MESSFEFTSVKTDEFDLNFPLENYRKINDFIIFVLWQIRVGNGGSAREQMFSSIRRRKTATAQTFNFCVLAT